ncbi:MAG TPA: nitronate monooxygenase [Candidatus Scatomorpha merdigallinarum]|nr:nitronate monooxygenase [Candidatus Scatomorpha merdigallinarum]
MAKVIKTKVTEKLGIEYPIIQGCMQSISRAPLVAAVSEAGGLGIISSSTFSNADDLRHEIQLVKEKTSKPFGVNLTLMPALVVPDYEGYIRVCKEEGVKVMETAGRPPKDDMVDAIKSAGMTLIHKCTTVKHALKAQKIGADMVVADGCECAGHPGENDITTMALTPACVEALDIPVITAGGVATGRQMAAALMLGGEAVYVGTRFLLSEESPVLPEIKKYLAENATEMDTMILMRSFTNSTRVYKNNVAKKVYAMEQEHCTFDDIKDDVAGKTASHMFFVTGDVENEGLICVGESAGVIHDVLPVKQIIDDMMAECVATLSKFDA